MNPENVTVVKEQTYKSSKEYKNYIYADSGENYMFGLYENENGKTIVPFNVFESAKFSVSLDIVENHELFKAKEPIFISEEEKTKQKPGLKHIFMLDKKLYF